jgi:hypothetical protein
VADKKTELSITLRTVDEATAKIKAVNAHLDALTKPTRDFQKALGDLREKSGLNNVIAGFKGVGSAIGDVLSKAGMIGGVLAGATIGAGAALLRFAHDYDELGKTSARLGVSADFLAQMRDAAERTGVPIEELDAGLDAFSVNLGKARANAGRMAAFLPKISTNLHSNFGAALLTQLKGAKDNAAAVDVLAAAMSRLKNASEREALAKVVTGDEKLAPLFAQGPEAIKKLREHFAKLAPDQAAAAKAGAEVGEAMHDLSNASDGVKTALVIGLKPALVDIAARMTKWLTGHRTQIQEMAESIGKKLPGAIEKVANWLDKAWTKANKFVDAVGGIKNVAIGVAALLAGPLFKAVTDLSLALLTAGGRATALARGMGGIPSTVGGAGAAAAGTGAGEGAAVAGGASIVGSLAVPVGIGFGAKYLLNKLGLDDLGGGNELARKSGPNSFMANWLKQGGYADDESQSPLELVRRGIDRVRDANSHGLGDAGAAGLIGPELLRGLRGAPMASQAPQQAKITIELKNAPKGTRATVDPGSTADVDLSTGYQLFTGL